MNNTVVTKSVKSVSSTSLVAVAGLKTPMPKWAKNKRRSEMSGACLAVWEICDEATENGERKMSRAKLIKRCVKAGIAYFTARTQVQAWKKEMGL